MNVHTDYFHRRNRPSAEYSGHEEVSPGLRTRLVGIYKEYVSGFAATGHELDLGAVKHAVVQQLLQANVDHLLATADHDHVFTVMEVLHDLSIELDPGRRKSFRFGVREAFRLSGSVYTLDDHGRVNRVPSETLAKKLAEVEPVLSPYPKSFIAFYNAVGDLMGRRRKADDIVKDLFVGAEGYLKSITGANDYGAAIKELHKRRVLNTIQRGLMEKLYGYRSDADGVGHAGNTAAPTEMDALWFLETMLAQLSHIDRKIKRQTN